MGNGKEEYPSVLHVHARMQVLSPERASKDGNTPPSLTDRIVTIRGTQQAQQAGHFGSHGSATNALLEGSCAVVVGRWVRSSLQ